MPAPARSVNAWLMVGEDDPPDTTYFSPNSSYRWAVRHGVYRYVTMLNIAFFETVPVGKDTVPDSSSAQGYTIQIQGASVVHPGTPGDPTTQQYFEQLIKDARAQNPGLPLLATLNWGDERTISRIFSSPDTQKCAETFARNLVGFFQHYGLNGLDIDWEPPLSDETTGEQLNALLTAVRAEYAKHPSPTCYLTLSPVTANELTGTVINANVDFVTLQLYGDADPKDYTSPPCNIDSSLLAYGAKFEAISTRGPGYQTAQQAHRGYQEGKYRHMTQWRLNSLNFPYEQAQQMILYQLVFGVPGDSFDDGPIVAAADNAPISQIVVRAGEVVDALQVTNTGIVLTQSQSYQLPRHGGSGGTEHVQNVSTTDPIVTMSGFTGTWFGRNVVLQVQFTTRSGVTLGPYGSMNHATSRTPFNITAPAGQAIVAFNGATAVVPEAPAGTPAVIASLGAVFAASGS